MNMKYRAFSIPGTIFLVCALVLLIIVSISLPSFAAMDFARTHFGNGIRSGKDGDSISQVRFGIWSACAYRASNGDRICAPGHHGYAVQIQSPTTGDVATVGSSWTRGLAIHPVAAFLTLIAFACDIALFAFAKHKFGDLSGVGANTNTGPAFWLTFVSFLLLCFAGCTVCFGRRRLAKEGTSSSYDMPETSFWKRLRRIY